MPAARLLPQEGRAESMTASESKVSPMAGVAPSVFAAELMPHIPAATGGNGHSHERRQLPGLGGLGLGLPPLPLNGLGLDPSALAGQATSQLSGLGLGNLGAGAGGLGLGGLTNTVAGLQGQLGGLAGAAGGQGLGLGLLNGLPVAGPLVGQVGQAAGLQNLLGGAQSQGQGLGLSGLTGQVNGLLGGLQGQLGTTLNTVQGTVNGLEGQLGNTLNTVQGTVGGLTAGTPLAGLSGTLGGLTSSLGLANLQQALTAQATQIQQLQQLLQSVNVPLPDAANAPSNAQGAVPDPSISGAANAANNGLNAANDATTQAANLAAAQYAQAVQALGGLLPNNAQGHQLPSVAAAIPSGAGGAFVGANQALTPARQAGGQALTAASNALNNAGALPSGQQLAQQAQGITQPVQAGLPPALSDLISQLQGAAPGVPSVALPPLGAASTNDLLAQWQQQAAGYSTAAQQQLQSLGLFTPNTGKVLAAVPGSSSADAASLTPAGVARTAFDAPVAGAALDATDDAPAVPAVAPLADAQIAADGQAATASEAAAAEVSTLSSWAPMPSAPASATTTGVAPSSTFNAMTYLAPPLTADPTREVGPTDVAFYTSNVPAPATATSTSSAAAPPASSAAAPEAPAASDQPQPQPVQKRDSLLSPPAQPQALPAADDALGNEVSEQSRDSHLQPLAPNVAPYLQQYAYADAPLPLSQPTTISPAASFVSAWSTTPLPSAALQSLPTPPSAASDPLPTFGAFAADQIPAVKAVSGKRPAPTPYSGWSQDTRYNENSGGKASSGADAEPQDGSAASSSAPAPSSAPSVEGVAPPPIPLRNRNRLLRQRRQLKLQPESSSSPDAKANKDDGVFDGVGNIRLDPHKQAGDAGSSSSGHTGGVPHPPSNWSQDTVYSDGSGASSRAAAAGAAPAPAAPLHNANSPAKALLGQRDVADSDEPAEAIPPATKTGRPAMLRQRAFDRRNPDHVHSSKDHDKKEPCHDPKHHHHTKKPPAAPESPAPTEPDATEAAPERLRLTRMVRFKRAAKQGDDDEESNGTGGAEDDDYHPTGPPPPAKNMHTPPAGEHGMSAPVAANADALTPKAPKARSKASSADVADDDETAAEEEADAPAPKPKSKPSKDSEGAKKGKKDGKKASSSKKGKDGKKKSSPKTAKASEAEEDADDEPAVPKETPVEKLRRRFAKVRGGFRNSR